MCLLTIGCNDCQDDQPKTCWGQVVPFCCCETRLDNIFSPFLLVQLYVFLSFLVFEIFCIQRHGTPVKLGYRQDNSAAELDSKNSGFQNNCILRILGHGFFLPACRIWMANFTYQAKMDLENRGFQNNWAPKVSKTGSKKMS